MFFLNHQKAAMRKEVIWVFSNLASETSEVVSVFINLRIYQKFLEMIFNDTDQIKSEIIWTVSNSFMSAHKSQVQVLNQMNWIDVFIKVYEESKDSQVKMVILEGLYESLKKDQDRLQSELKNKLKSFLELNDGNELIDKRIDKVLNLFEYLDDEQIEGDVEMDVDN